VFAELAEHNPALALAQACFDRALPALMATQNFALAAGFFKGHERWLLLLIRAPAMSCAAR